MKPQTLPVKRRPAPKGVFHKLSAVTRSRKQRVTAAAPAEEMDAEDGSSRISRALTIIFLIHIVAVVLIFVHKHFLDGRRIDMPATASKEVPGEALQASSPPSRSREALPRLSNGDKVYVVQPGDNYSRIAEREGVEEAALRQANQQIEIRPGLILSVPPRRIVAEEPAEVARIRGQAAAPESATTASEDGLVPAIDVRSAPRAQAVAATQQDAPTDPASGSAAGRRHVVKAGENIWRISQKYKVGQDDLMKANKITDARKIRAGMELVIPD